MRRDQTRPSFVGFARPAHIGALLRLGPEPLSVVWSNPSRQLHSAGVGVLAEGGGEVKWISTLPPRPPPGPWFGGWAFDAQRAWAGFDAERWVLPEVLAWWDGRQPWIAAFGPAGATVSQLEARLDTVHEVEPSTGGVSAQRAPCDRGAWTALVEGALGAIAAGRFSKVVGARVIDVTATQPYPERAILKALEARHKQCWSFLVRGRDGRAFVGASPETLCEAHEDILVTEALAGTAAGGQGTALLRSEKDRREHAAVVDAIRETLTPFSLALEVANAPAVKVLSNVDHLHTPIRAKLKPGVSALEVARALHPTPAVGGTPREPAMTWLRANEGFERGWYTGVVGAMGPGRLTLAVALRAALVDGAKARVFVGAGLVEGSTPDAEWLETERKARAMLPALGVNDG